MVRVPNVPLSIVATVSCTGVSLDSVNGVPLSYADRHRACQICAGAHATYELSPQMGAGLRSKRSGFLSSPESHYRGPASSSRNAADVWRARPAMDVFSCLAERGATPAGSLPVGE